MTLVIGADGETDAWTPPADDCCPSLLPGPCALVCTFVNLLPTGPLWDGPKERALARYVPGPDDTCVANPVADPSGCTSVVNYAIYLGKVLNDLIVTGICPTVREMDPFTAVTTLDDWLERLGWEDCFATVCRSRLLGALSPYEVMGVCGPIRCDIEPTEDVQCALKHALVIALQRYQMAGVKTLDVINWIIEPLDSILEPSTPEETDPDRPCSEIAFNLRPITKTLEACQLNCGAPPEPATVPNVIKTRGEGADCGPQPAGLPEEIYPGTVAAECIVRSILSGRGPVVVHQVCPATP